MEKETHWNKVSNWYDSVVGELGSYYHQQIIIPNVLRLLELRAAKSTLLDLACGQGVLARHLPKGVGYLGLDAAKDLIKKAQNMSREHAFKLADITKPFPIANEERFTHAASILALQNIEHPDKVLLHLKEHLVPQATLVVVLNHPCFRIPRQSAWGFDEQAKLQYRRINSYMTAQKIPIVTHPGQNRAAQTWSFHHPLSAYFGYLKEAGFLVEAMEEWCSDKVSTGSAARWENRARKEFPLFLALKAKRI